MNTLRKFYICIATAALTLSGCGDGGPDPADIPPLPSYVKTYDVQMRYAIFLFPLGS